MARLDAYRSKRRFDKTPEPQGGLAATDDAIFVIQKHRASHLHYDLRLQVGDTLRSWAVPEGPCLDPKVRRFAKQVEDHPLDYASFEGRIPAGQYGAGEVIVWDQGTWVTTADAEAALENGELKFRLAGEKLSGGWMLKRLPDDPTNWLLIKERDIAVRPLAEYDVLVERPDSVLSSKRVAEAAKPRKAVKPAKAEKIAGARKADMPAKWKPQLAGQADLPPKGGEWLHEIKFDGYRTLAFINAGKVRLITRNGLEWTKRYAPLDKAFLKLGCETAIIDGEIAVQDVRGVTVLSDLEAALST
ncbi:MAG: DNA polymerase ligase N-terminal domain-containing protein, partial [Hyphomonadaceae bacterium]